MDFLYLKAIHIIFIVTWFAGLFYMPRLLIYLTEAHQKAEPERSVLTRQLKIMAERLWYGITWPSAILTLIMGTTMIIQQPEWLSYGFMHVKLSLVFLLYLYHGSIHFIFRLLKKDIVRYSSRQLRIWNEVATLFLISIVFIIVLKNALSMVWGIVGLILITALIMIGIHVFKKLRKDE